MHLHRLADTFQRRKQIHDAATCCRPCRVIYSPSTALNRRREEQVDGLRNSKDLPRVLMHCHLRDDASTSGHLRSTSVEDSINQVSNHFNGVLVPGGRIVSTASRTLHGWIDHTTCRVVGCSVCCSRGNGEPPSNICVTPAERATASACGRLTIPSCIIWSSGRTLPPEAVRCIAQHRLTFIPYLKAKHRDEVHLGEDDVPLNGDRKGHWNSYTSIVLVFKFRHAVRHSSCFVAQSMFAGLGGVPVPRRSLRNQHLHQLDRTSLLHVPSMTIRRALQRASRNVHLGPDGRPLITLLQLVSSRCESPWWTLDCWNVTCLRITLPHAYCRISERLGSLEQIAQTSDVAARPLPTTSITAIPDNNAIDTTSSNGRTSGSTLHLGHRPCRRPRVLL